MLKFFDDLQLAKKLLVLFGIFMLLLLAAATNSITSNQNLYSQSTSHITKGIPRVATLGQALSAIKEMRIIVYTYQNNADTPAEEAELFRRFDETKTALNEAIKNFTAITSVAPEEAAPLRNAADKLISSTEHFMTVRKTGDRAASLELMNGESRIASHDASEAANGLLESSIALANHRGEETTAYAKWVNLVSAILAVLCVTTIIIIWNLLNRSVALPLHRIAQVTTTLANGGKADIPYLDRHDEVGQIAEALEAFRTATQQQLEAEARSAAEQATVMALLGKSMAAVTTGDLTAQLGDDFPASYAELKINFNESLQALRDLIRGVTESTNAIRTGSEEIAQASEDLARRTESNAASLEETSAAVTQMDERLRVTAAAAGQTVERADSAMVVVQSGRDIADQAVQAMGRVSESAKGIDSVIEGLDKIAFQTRVLAMNAAVEAGRAGDAGRGFAVVADLVSALAMRSEEEAKRAREQLTATQTDIGTAVEAVQRVDGALESISGGVSEVNALLREIAEDNTAQSATITEISATISTMDQATQQNAAMVEESSAAVRNLNSEVTSLAERTATFRVDNGVAPRRYTPPSSIGIKKPTPPRVAVQAPPVSDDDWMDF